MSSDDDFEMETLRLHLRDLKDEDWPLVHALASEHQVARYQTWFRLGDEAACRQWLHELLARTNRARPRLSYNLGISLRADPALIGWVGFGPPSDPSEADTSVGYALLPAYWNRGYMTEAVIAVIGFVLDALGKGSICANCTSNNVSSARVLEKAGMRLAGRWDEADPDTGVMEEHLRYRLDRP